MTILTMHGLWRHGLAVLLLALAAQSALAEPLREGLAQCLDAQQDEALDEGEAEDAIAALPANVQVVRDVAYGRDNEQRFDVYLPRATSLQNAPVILMVHGGGWYRGDKAMRSVVENKVRYWVPRGYIFISTNYRLLPKAAPVEQAEDVARALALAQRYAPSWGGDPAKFILMGHSAGAHLVALLSAAPDRAARVGAAPWLGTVALDGANLDVVQLMEAPHAPLFDNAFGDNPLYWRLASPYHQLSANARPILLVCSTLRAAACPQAQHFASRAAELGVRAPVSAQALGHRAINQSLGEPGRYTATVDAFILSLLRPR